MFFSHLNGKSQSKEQKMKRRTFLKGVAQISAGAASVSTLVTGCSSTDSSHIEVGAISQNPKPVKELENEYIKFVLNSDASTEMLDKKTGTHWRMGRVALQEDVPIDVGHVWLRTGRSSCEQYPGRFYGKRVGESVRFVLLGRQQQAMGTFMCDVRLDGDWIEFVIKDIDERLESLVFPTPIESESLVVPQKLGRWIRKPLRKILLAFLFQSEYAMVRWAQRRRWVDGGLQ